ncbi:MAG: hypothetical protein M1832_001733 [Thelocarpon impressellum]|nr:MAG: hypothetical protein M1832_001733 [Thelocarpon impressellum]
MPGFFSKVFGGKDGTKPSKSGKHANQPYQNVPVAQKPRWEDAWLRKDVEAEDVQELLRGCTLELKSRALDVPFLLLPFRPTSDPSAARTFVRNYFNPGRESTGRMPEGQLHQELRLTEPMVTRHPPASCASWLTRLQVLCSVIKWCWSRLPGGVVTWEAYELFRVGEQGQQAQAQAQAQAQNSDMARDAFATFIPLSVDSDARTKIIFDFFDLMAAVAAHGKSNGLGGRKLSRLAGWWAFEHQDTGDGFEGGYKSAADATSHLFFAYLRSLSPNSVRGLNGISALPRSLQTLVQDTEYPPETPSLMQTRTSNVVMIVDRVSPTPFALLRRARHFAYRDDDPALQAFADLEDPVEALTEECRRVLKCISSTNQSDVSTSKASTSLRDASWSRFEDIGFSGLAEESEHDDDGDGSAMGKRRGMKRELSSTANSRVTDLGRPTTPSWADFLSAGFVDEPNNRTAPLMLPPDKILPPIDTHRGNTSQSHRLNAHNELNLEPGELASIAAIDFEDCFWWVWITSLAGEEPTERKAVFGRCALVETSISGGRWLILEEKVKGAAPVPEEGAYIVEKKSRFGLSKRGKSYQGKLTSKKNLAPPAPSIRSKATPMASKTSIGPDQHARIQAAAAALQKKQKQQGEGETDTDGQQAVLRRARAGDGQSTKTNSVFTLQPVILSEAAPAMKWANKFDKDVIREAYLGNDAAGRGSQLTLPLADDKVNGNGNASAPAVPGKSDRDLPALPHGGASGQGSSAAVAPQRTITPSPLPPTPPTAEETTIRGGVAAAEVPLPADDRPPPPTKDVGADQRYSPSPEPASMEQARGGESARTTPEKKGKVNKLKKGNANSGIKKLFGKKKAEEPAPAPVSAPARPEPQAPQRSGLGRRLSNLRKNKAPDSAGAPAAPPAYDTSDSAAVSQTEITPVQTPHAEAAREPSPDPSEVSAPEPEREVSREPARERRTEPYQAPWVDSSRTNTAEERDAAHAFSSFDQGPMDDVPAFVPEDSPERPATPIKKTDAAPESKETRAPVQTTAPVQDVSPVKDRWAQIRKNAAASRAAAETEDPPRQSNTTDDGQTSGEETIESRVARIKARVAELTNNMESEQPVKQGR